MTTIPIMRPRLPLAAQLAPYLSAIDSSRVYSNFGPLVFSLEERLAARFNLPAGGVTTVANATLGLTLALAAKGAGPGSLCVMPAWTFIASAHAAKMAGLVPYFVDVDRETWALDPETIADVIAGAPGPVGAVMPVAPFGRPLDVAAWDRFQVRTGVPVVIDAAAGFDAMTPGAVPAVVSLHATKIFAAGEGGFVMSTDASLVSDIRARSNFGFHGSREAAVAAANAKLSEYHAAVALASLDEWIQVRDEWMAAARAYRDELSESNRLRFQDGFGTSWIATTCVLELSDVGAAPVETRLAAEGIETRQWWGAGAHTHPATAACPRASLASTEALAGSTIAIPFFRNIEFAEIQRVARGILAVTNG
jgi:dTDP-4-amino-4,6-dideoxygalactose transaminase